MTIGFIYPAYESYKALESKRTDAAAEWLTYWVIFSLFSVFESVADWLISWIPFYYILKLLFLLWLLLPRFKVRSSSSPSHDRHPQTHRLTPETRKHVRGFAPSQGASKLYNRFLQPLIQKHEAKIDQKLNEGYATAMSLSSRGLAFGNNLLNRRP